MKLRTFTASCLIMATIGCSNKPKQLTYSENIKTHLDKVQSLIADNNNTIDQSNIPSLKQEWNLAIDNVKAFEAEDKSHPCNEPECMTAKREGSEQISSLKQFIIAAKRDTSINLNDVFANPY